MEEVESEYSFEVITDENTLKTNDDISDISIIDKINCLSSFAIDEESNNEHDSKLEQPKFFDGDKFKEENNVRTSNPLGIDNSSGNLIDYSGDFESFSSFFCPDLDNQCDSVDLNVMCEKMKVLQENNLVLKEKLEKNYEVLKQHADLNFPKILQEIKTFQQERKNFEVIIKEKDLEIEKLRKQNKNSPVTPLSKRRTSTKRFQQKDIKIDQSLKVIDLKEEFTTINAKIVNEFSKQIVQNSTMKEQVKALKEEIRTRDKLLIDTSLELEEKNICIEKVIQDRRELKKNQKKVNQAEVKEFPKEKKSFACTDLLKKINDLSKTTEIEQELMEFDQQVMYNFSEQIIQNWNLKEELKIMEEQIETENSLLNSITYELEEKQMNIDAFLKQNFDMESQIEDKKLEEKEMQIQLIFQNSEDYFQKLEEKNSYFQEQVFEIQKELNTKNFLLHNKYQDLEEKKKQLNELLKKETVSTRLKAKTRKIKEKFSSFIYLWTIILIRSIINSPPISFNVAISDAIQSPVNGYLFLFINILLSSLLFLTVNSHTSFILELSAYFLPILLGNIILFISIITLFAFINILLFLYASFCKIFCCNWFLDLWFNQIF